MDWVKGFFYATVNANADQKKKRSHINILQSFPSYAGVFRVSQSHPSQLITCIGCPDRVQVLSKSAARSDPRYALELQFIYPSKSRILRSRSLIVFCNFTMSCGSGVVSNRAKRRLSIVRNSAFWDCMGQLTEL
jgi:hypothetical protein